MAVMEQDLIRTMPEPMIQPSIEVSAQAAQRLSAMMREKELTGYALRVFVSGGGCSGLQYGMTFDNDLREGDSEFSIHSLRIVVDPISGRYLKGATIDFNDNLMGGGFKIDNPNAVSSCGCGHSFRTSDDGSDEESSGGGCGTCGSH